MSDKNRFILHNEKTVVDTREGLMWTRTDSMNDLERWVNYQDGTDYVRNLNEQKFAGFGDWRLPTKEEMSTIYDESLSIKDKFGKDIHISDCFASGGGFSMIAQIVSGRMRTWVFNLRDGQYDQPDGLWTLSEAARAVRSMTSSELQPNNE